MIPKEVSSRIIDNAREAVIDELTRWDYTSQRDERERANSVLALSGTTDIECPGGCYCDQCKGTGIIKYKWKVSVVLENGKLPQDEFYHAEGLVLLNETGEMGKKAYEESQRDMLSAGYKQVVE